jgi:hypothetical protein
MICALEGQHLADRFPMEDSRERGTELAVDPGRAADCSAAASVATDLLESECEAHCPFPPPGM